MNSVNLVGRLTADPETEQYEANRRRSPLLGEPASTPFTTVEYEL